MIDDIDLRRHVLDELRWDPAFDATHVGVTAADGAVVLSGHVDSYAALFAARKAARRVAGVKAVADELDVRLAPTFERDDADVAESIAHVLRCNVTLAEQDVQAEVRDGVVTLSGTVDLQSQRRHVERQVAHVAGVRELRNEIALRPQSPADDIGAAIEAALARHAELDAGCLTIDVDGHAVTLGGTVATLRERDLVEMAAWSAPGVRDVDNAIRVA